MAIEDPNFLCWAALLEKDDVCLHALAVRSERAARQTQDGVQIAILHQDFEYFACFAFEKTIVREHHCSASTGLERVHYVLDKIELLVTGFDSEVVAIRSLVRSFCTEWRIRKNHIIAFAAIRFINGIAEIDVRFDAVQIEIHECKTARACHEFLSIISGCTNSTRFRAIEYSLAGIHEPL